MGREDGRVQTVYAGVYTCTRHYTASDTTLYTAEDGPRTRPHTCTRTAVYTVVYTVHGLYTAVYTDSVHGCVQNRVQAVYTAIYTAVYGPCKDCVHSCYTTVYGGVTPFTRRAQAVYACTRPCTWPVHGRVDGPCTAVYGPCTLGPCTGVHVYTCGHGRVRAVYMPCTLCRVHGTATRSLQVRPCTVSVK